MPVVVATGAASISSVPGLGKLLTTAMSKAILLAAEHGYNATDDAEMYKKYMQHARAKTKREFMVMVASENARVAAQMDQAGLEESDTRVAAARAQAETLYPVPEPLPGPKPAPKE